MTTPAAALLALSVLAAGCGHTQATQRLVAPAFTYVADTGSMRPVIVGGEQLLITACDIADVRRGDLIVSWWPAKQLNVLHRVVKVRNTSTGIGLVTKGDANPERDTAITTAATFIGCAYVIQP